MECLHSVAWLKKPYRLPVFLRIRNLDGRALADVAIDVYNKHLVSHVDLTEVQFIEDVSHPFGFGLVVFLNSFIPLGKQMRTKCYDALLFKFPRLNGHYIYKARGTAQANDFWFHGVCVLGFAAVLKCGIRIKSVRHKNGLGAVKTVKRRVSVSAIEAHLSLWLSPVLLVHVKNRSRVLG